MKISALLLQILVVASCARAQLTVDWFTIDGGGGSATGGGYALSGTAGQPDAGTMTGGGFTFHGGFWGATLPPARPRLSITMRDGVLVLSWQPSVNAVVQTTTTLTPTDPMWQAYPADPMRVGDHFELILGPAAFPADPMRFFRLARP